MSRSRALTQRLISAFEKAGVSDPKMSAQHIVAAVAGRQPASPLSAAQEAQIMQAAARRCTHEPVQYILGDWDFRQLNNIEVRQPVFIPRPETEELASLAQRVCAEHMSSGRTVRFLEVGCGSGAISVSLLHGALYPEASQGPPAAVWGTAVDIGKEACELTLRNATKFGVSARLLTRYSDSTGSSAAVGNAGAGTGGEGCSSGRPGEGARTHPTAAAASSVRLNIIHGDALSLALQPSPGGGTLQSDTSTADAVWAATRATSVGEHPHSPPFDLLVSNPPYIPDEDEPTLHPQVTRFEDRRALYGGPPLGAGFVLRMLRQAAAGSWLRPGADVLLELDSIHPALLADIFALPPHSPLRTLATASGFAGAASREGAAPEPLVSKAWALEQDWAPRHTRHAEPLAAGSSETPLNGEAGGVDARVALTREMPGQAPVSLAAASRAWDQACTTWAPLAADFELCRLYSDLYGRPRFVHLKRR